MPKLTATDHPINYRPGSNGLNSTWGLSIGDKPIGTVWETEDDKYAGQIEGTNATGAHREYTCPALPFRSSVIERLGEMVDRLGLA